MSSPPISSKSSTTTSSKETMVKNKNLSPFLIEKIKQFLDDYQCELRFKKLNQSLTKTSTSSSLRTFSSMISGGGNSGGYDYGYGNNNSNNMIADPTTANALQTSTVVLRKKKNKNKNLSFDGIQLSNYRIKFNNVYGEIFDWIYHFLWLK